MKALRKPYIRSSEGVTSGTRAGPEGMPTIPVPTVTCAIPRRTIAVVCAVRQATTRINTRVNAATKVPASGQRSTMPVAAPTSSTSPSPSALTMPNVVGRR